MTRRIAWTYPGFGGPVTTRLLFDGKVEVGTHVPGVRSWGLGGWTRHQHFCWPSVKGFWCRTEKPGTLVNMHLGRLLISLVFCPEVREHNRELYQRYEVTT